MNRGTNWLTSELLGIGAQPLDESTVEELETRLLTADVGVDATTWLVDAMRAAAKRNPGTPAVELLRRDGARLAAHRRGAARRSRPRSKPFVILAIGVNGTGKTTTVGKLAHRLKAKGHTVLLAAADTFRAAAVEQLQEWGERARGAGRRTGPRRRSRGRRPRRARRGTGARHRRRARRHGGPAAYGGRAHGRARRRSSASFSVSTRRRRTRSLLVLDASQGQNALAQALKFHERLKLTGVAITKLDGTAKGGILLAIARQLKVPIRLVARRRRCRGPRRFPRRRVRAGAARRRPVMIRFENVYKRYPNGREALSGVSFEHRARRVRVPDGPVGRRQEHAAALDRAHRAADARHRARQQPEHGPHRARARFRRSGNGSASCSKTTSCSTTAASSTTSHCRS